MNTTLHIINLPHRKDRLESVLSQLKEQGITDSQIHNGVTGHSLPQTNISKAHKQIVAEAKHAGLTNVIIGEDDLKFTAPGAWQYFIDNIPPSYDLYLASIYTGTIKQDGTVNSFSGLTLYSVHERFYDTFLSIDETQHLDRGLAKKGQYFCCHQFCAIQHNGFSDQKNKHCNYDHYLDGRVLFACSTNPPHPL